MECKIPVLLAYFMACYTIASFLYIFTTRFINIGTPLKDKINSDPELKKIRDKARKERGMIFFVSFYAAFVFLYIVRPFSSCDNLENIQELILTNTI